MKRVPIVVIVTALITGFILYIDSCNSSKKIIKPDKTEIIRIKQQADIINSKYLQAFQRADKQNDSLQKQLAALAFKLRAAKMKLKQSEISLVQKANANDKGLPVSIQLSNCDSLKAQTLNYIAKVDSVNTIYESTITSLKNVATVKDSQIVVCNNAYDSLQLLQEQQILREQQLTNELNTVYKVQKRKRIQNKVLGAGMLILSGIITTFLISSTK